MQIVTALSPDLSAREAFARPLPTPFWLLFPYLLFKASSKRPTNLLYVLHILRETNSYDSSPVEQETSRFYVS